MRQGSLVQTTPRGWMTGDTFVWWLKRFDDQLERPTLLLIDSCPAHNNIEYRDNETKENWKFLTICRLPKNSTPVTQPLDAGVISVFKRAYLELLSEETSLIRSTTDKTNLSNAKAWELIIEAWSHVKPRTLRSCFAKTPVLPPDMRAEVKGGAAPRAPVAKFRRRHNKKDEERSYFERLIAETGEKNNWNFKEQEVQNQDEQDLAYEDFMDELMDMEVEDVAVPTTEFSNYQDTHYDPRSSPIDPEDYEATSELLEDHRGGFDIGSVDGLQVLRQNVKLAGIFEDDPDAGKEVNACLKRLMRACGDAKRNKRPTIE